MFTETFTYGDVTVVVRRPTIRDGLARTTITEALKDHPTSAGYKIMFATLVTQIASAQNLPLARPESATEVSAAYEKFLDLDAELIVQWDKAVERVNAPIGSKKAEPPTQPSSTS